ncbi:VanZ family protein [Alkalihalophilus lindianensis]|uniref:VanZ family protein n=1 Tax=Alkalihalophilus lindianensis TaxID=1630542 RepID=A0ABU3X8Y9_9BACI|nr:VanZ family protein [Alkalihalophilus lindianensis]MDV2684352.1 VanZ family protein [Alkalihalophilus lindianensis]
MLVKHTWSWVCVLLWMALIFYLSHQPATESAELSSGIMERIVAVVEIVVPTIHQHLDTVHLIIRKGAHFFAYFILGILVIHALRGGRLTGYRRVLLALSICVLYAISDEVHQLFIPGRSGEVTDVLIDSAGASGGIGLYLLAKTIKRKRV